MMMNGRFIFAAIILSSPLAGCADLGDLANTRGRKIEYQDSSHQSSNPLELPPDLVTIPSPDSAGGETSISRYRVEEVQTPTEILLPAKSAVAYRRDGRLRWLEAERPADEVWTLTRQFWLDLGFQLEIDEPSLGVMETDWVQNRAKIVGTGITGLLDKYLERFHDTGERDKFRTRIERGSRPGTTEIYLSLRSVGEVSIGAGAAKFQRLPHDLQLETEILRRLMLALGESEEIAEQSIAAAEESEDAFKLQDGKLIIKENFDRAWRHIALALDRTGFTVEDRDRTLGRYYIRYTGFENTPGGKPPKSLFGSLAFWKKEEARAQNLQIALAAEENATAVSVLTEGDSPAGEKLAATILSLLAENL